MREEGVFLQSPPRLLLGVGLMFWGAMSDYALMGLIAAVLVEGRNWVSLRWDFGEKGFVRAWQLSVVILIVVAVVFLSSGEERTSRASLALLGWLPVIFLPLILAQQYALDAGVPVTTFSYFARRKIRLDREAGREVVDRSLQIGLPYLGLTLISAGLGLRSLFWYGLSVAVLFGVGLYFMRRERVRPVAWAGAYFAALVLAGGLASGVYFVYGKLAKSQLSYEAVESAREIRTSLGQVRNLQLSPRIDWRYYQIEGVEPERLRMAVYDVPGHNRWSAMQPESGLKEKLDAERDVGGGFELLHVKEGDFAYVEEDFEREQEQRGKLVGLVDDESLIPVPPNQRVFVGVETEGVEANFLGSTRLSDPLHGALEIEMSSGDVRVVGGRDLDPTLRDLRVPKPEMEGVTRFLEEELGVEELPDWGREISRKGEPEWTARKADREGQERLWRQLQMKFYEEFEYSLKLRPARDRPAVTYFLEKKKDSENKEIKRKGHCEYFATATAMVMRRAGIPTRYVVGYVIEEQGEEAGEWILRGKHAHAWAQAYLGGEWVNEAEVGAEKPLWRCRGGEWVTVDLTPPQWLETNFGRYDWKQKVADWWQKVRADLIIWFSGPVVSMAVKVLLGLVFVGLIYRVVHGLWTTRGGGGEDLAESWRMRARSGNPLAEFEAWLAKKVGARPAGMPMARWLQGVAPEMVPVYQELRFDPEADEGVGKELPRLEEAARKRLSD